MIPVRDDGRVRVPEEQDSPALEVPDVSHPPFREFAVPAFGDRLQDLVMGLD